MRRYRVARAMGNYEEVVAEDSRLLDRYGLQLLAVDCGVHAAVKGELDRSGRVNPWNTVTLDEKTWHWLRPILVRLDELETGRGQALAAK